MIQRAKEIIQYDIPTPCNGTGYVHITSFLDPRLAYGTGRGFCLCRMPVGASCGVHQHVGEIEQYYILKGKARVTDNGTEAILEPGDMILCDDGGTHSIANAGDGDLEYISLILFTGLVCKEAAKAE